MGLAVHDRVFPLDGASNVPQCFAKFFSWRHGRHLLGFDVLRKPSLQLFHVTLWADIPTAGILVPFRAGLFRRPVILIRYRKVDAFRRHRVLRLPLLHGFISPEPFSKRLHVLSFGDIPAFLSPIPLCAKVAGRILFPVRNVQIYPLPNLLRR